MNMNQHSPDAVQRDSGAPLIRGRNKLGHFNALRSAAIPGLRRIISCRAAPGKSDQETER